jgi:hypothetical protein
MSLEGESQMRKKGNGSKGVEAEVKEGSDGEWEGGIGGRKRSVGQREGSEGRWEERKEGRQGKRDQKGAGE